MSFWNDIKRNYKLRQEGAVKEGEGRWPSYTRLGRALAVAAGALAAGLAVAPMMIVGFTPYIVFALVYTALSLDEIHKPSDLVATLWQGWLAPATFSGDIVSGGVKKAGVLADATRDAWRNRRARQGEELPEAPPEAEGPWAFPLQKDLRASFRRNSEMSPDGTAPKRDDKPLLRVTM